jgi:hypothetical protein
MPFSDRLENAAASSCHRAVSRPMWPPTGPRHSRNCSNAGPKSLVDRPCRYSSGNTSTTCEDFRAQAGRIADENRFRSPGLFVNALVVDPRRPHRHRAGRGGDLPFDVITVTDHQPVTSLVDLVAVGIDVRGNLGPQRRGKHRPRAVADDLIQQRPTDAASGRVGLGLLLDYLEHGRTFPASAPTPALDQTHLGFRSSSGRCARSRHLARGPSTGSNHCSSRLPI